MMNKKTLTLNKKQYESPKMEVIEMEYDTVLLAGSGNVTWRDDKCEHVCGKGRNKLSF